MTEPTVSRATLRKAIARRMTMPFTRRVGDSSLLTASTTTIEPVDANKLLQSDDFWSGSYFYNSTRDATRYIKSFVQNTKKIILESLIAGQVSGDSYEIHSIWNADDIHAAINSAIESGFPAFFDFVTDESIITNQDQMAYDLTALAVPPWMISKVWLEMSTNVMRGKPTSATSGAITNTALINQLGLVTSAWKVSIWDGLGVGQIRSVSSVVNATGQVLVTPAWTVTPDTTSQYSIWNPNIQRDQWYQIIAARPDQHEFPNFLHIFDLYPSYYGMRLRLQYASRPVQLAVDTDTTMVPQEFILDRAMATLYEQLADDTRVDRARYSSLAEYYATKAEAYRQSRAFRQPDGTLWQESLNYNSSSLDSADPLGWRGGPY